MRINIDDEKIKLLKNVFTELGFIPAPWIMRKFKLTNSGALVVKDFYEDLFKKD